MHENTVVLNECKRSFSLKQRVIRNWLLCSLWVLQLLNCEVEENQFLHPWFLMMGRYQLPFLSPGHSSGLENPVLSEAQCSLKWFKAFNSTNHRVGTSVSEQREAHHQYAKVSLLCCYCYCLIMNSDVAHALKSLRNFVSARGLNTKEMFGQE